MDRVLSMSASGAGARIRSPGSSPGLRRGLPRISPDARSRLPKRDEISSSRFRISARQSGFTLIEVVVALGIFALVAITLVELQGESLRNSGALADRVLAGIVAENRLVALMTARAAPAPGIREGESEMAGRTWLWRERILQTRTLGLLRIEIDVRRTPGGPVLAEISSVREGAAP